MSHKIRKISVLVLSFVLFFFLNANSINAYNVSGPLSVARIRTSGTQAGSKIFFAGGQPSEVSNFLSSTIDLFDLENGIHQTLTMAQGRADIVAISSGEKAFFIGGQQFINANNGGLKASDEFDIYDASVNIFVRKTLPRPREKHTATILGDKIFIAGGESWFDNSNPYGGNPYALYSPTAVDIYNVTTDTWSIAQLSSTRTHLTATSVCNRVMFAGGRSSVASSTVDIYDSTTNTWSSTNLSQARFDLVSATVGNKAYFIGGWTDGGGISDRIDVYDCDTNGWSTLTLPAPLANPLVTVVGSNIYLYDFARLLQNTFTWPTANKIVDIYHTDTGTWGTVDLANGFGYRGVANYKNTIFFAGGYGTSGTITKYWSQIDKIVDLDFNTSPTANAGPDQTANEGNQLNFNGSDSTDPDGISDIVSYSWDFGDGTTGTGVIATHTYTDNGTYTVTLTVTDNNGDSDTNTLIVTIETPAQAIQSLVTTVESFNLQQGIENSLDQKLQNAVDSLGAENAGNRLDAINKLEAFINSVEAQRGNQLTYIQADLLISAANRIINSLL